MDGFLNRAVSSAEKSFRLSVARILANPHQRHNGYRLPLRRAKVATPKTDSHKSGGAIKLPAGSKSLGRTREFNRPILCHTLHRLPSDR